MTSITVSKYLKDNYLTTGKCYYNYIFYSCPKPFLTYAIKALETETPSVKPCNLYINRALELGLEKTLDKTDSSFIRGLIATDFLNNMIMLEIMNVRNIEKTEDGLTKEIINQQLDEYLNGKLENAHANHANCADSWQIAKEILRHGKVELNIFLENTQNKDLQRAINSYIATYNPFHTKLFTTDKKLPTYESFAFNNYICAPHDFLEVDTNGHIFTMVSQNEKEKTNPQKQYWQHNDIVLK